MISGVSKVVVPVDDQEQAKEFWVDRLGFDLRSDESYGDERWIEVSPDHLPHSPVFFNCDDIEATYRALTERGVEFPVPPERQQFGWWALFADPDGTRYALGQWD
jgi:predicted enzyme related to lactoylglutathione lyase